MLNTLRINPIAVQYILTNCIQFYFWLVCAGLKLRIKVTLHNAEVRENNSLDGCNCTVCLLMIQMQGILYSILIINS